ncbi:MAG: phosphodiester glycosidase family protein [Bacteroidota bacterium]|nr:phosphodiester glycosidase family protein [Bacteroidota bacterium]
MELLKREQINTWFDLGLFIDRFKEEKTLERNNYKKSYADFKDQLKKGGLGFITYEYSVDGVTIEILKYAKIFQQNLPGIDIHLLGGNFQPESYKLIDENYKKHEIKEAASFDGWDLYKLFFSVKLERGSEKYNQLILDYWKQVLILIEKLGSYIEKEKIELLYLVNIASNPGNVALTLAIVIISEFFELPVINNNHDFYWEGGSREIDRIEHNFHTGPRDFFFTNSHLGEFFSLIEVLFPWESRSWMSVNINEEQINHLIKINGHNPANVCELGTAVDTSEFKSISKREKISTFYQFEKVLSRYKKTLIAYSAKDVVINKLVEEKNVKPILIGYGKTKPVNNFLAENIIFLQPTRIIGRKRIETGFRLVKRLFDRKKLKSKFGETDNLKLTILVTGPIAKGHYRYFEKLIKRFNLLVESLDEKFRDKVYLAFLFSELDKESFKKRFKNPVGIIDLYKIASLILLPSETEGRGLPIIESAASGVPIFCRRYYPEHVYSHVIGEHLPEDERLNVIEFDGKKIRNKQLEKIINIVFYPHTFSDVFKHNQRVVENRYSLESLTKNINNILQRLYLQLSSDNSVQNISRIALTKYKKIIDNPEIELKGLLNTQNRQYLPGFGKLEFMMNLKSLIDPSAFRAEEQANRGFIFSFAREILENDQDLKLYSEEKIIEFYNSIDEIFNICEGEHKIQHDHSFSYRHRNRKKMSYRDFTYQEFTGLVNMLYYEIIKPTSLHPIDPGIHFFTDWNLALSQLTASNELRIDDRDVLIHRMKANIVLGIFSGKYVKHELEFFVLQAIRSRYKLKLEEELTEEILLKKIQGKKPIYLFIREKSVIGASPAEEVIDFIKTGGDQELKLLLKHGLLKIIKTKQWCVGIHFAQSGREALLALKEIKEQRGLIISHHRNAAIMTDVVDIDRIHIDRVEDPITANIMGIPEGSGYIQYVPASVRVTLAYPTPIQTALDFHRALKSREFKELKEKLGEAVLFQEIRKDAIEKGTPIKALIEKLNQTKSDKKNTVEKSFVSGVYADRLPWNGAYVKTKNIDSAKSWKFVAVTSSGKTKTVTNFIKEFEKENNKAVEFAWNGGYILNPELVGKLGLPESYVGSPLGLIISDFNVQSPPLFNKPALLVHENGILNIKRVNCSGGLSLSNGKQKIEFTSKQYNIPKPQEQKCCFYDLLYDKEYFPAVNRIMVRLAGNKVMEIINTPEKNKIQNIPVGLTLSFPVSSYPDNFFQEGKELEIQLNEFKAVRFAVEAGPMLVDKGKECIDMKLEGWKTNNSIRTQAARLDYTDMRGPKIAAGIDGKGNFMVLTINGRIRESVGATHNDMAEILESFNIQEGMGFDPGGSSTLIFGKEVLNISPYNSKYERNIYSLPPEPRAVANAILGIYE